MPYGTCNRPAVAVSHAASSPAMFSAPTPSVTTDTLSPPLPAAVAMRESIFSQLRDAKVGPRSKVEARLRISLRAASTQGCKQEELINSLHRTSPEEFLEIFNFDSRGERIQKFYQTTLSEEAFNLIEELRTQIIDESKGVHKLS